MDELRGFKNRMKWNLIIAVIIIAIGAIIQLVIYIINHFKNLF